MFKKILIANRGEISLRVIRACREMGIRSVAVFSEADRNSLHVMLADEAYPIGPGPSRESYLCIPKIIEAAKASGADAVHPGYGFLSEKAEFGRAVAAAGLTFIGPNPECIDLMGDKLRAKETMKKAGVPCVPGSAGAIKDYNEAKTVAAQIKYPVMIKASAGGGGKGMRVVFKEEELERALQSAKSEALNAFNDDTVYMEKFVQNPKHIEIQVFGDMQGNVVHMYERECSIQRRNQKIIEESPSPSLPQKVREQMGDISVKAAKAIGYYNAGTFEFIFDSVTKDFYFMEMNTRLQVEHPVTELVTRIDLVKEQINVANGKSLSVKQEDIKQIGYAVQSRVYAEDPETYIPSPGLIHRCRNPQGPFIRVDSYAYPNFEVPIFYDSMLAKVIAWGHTREESIARLGRALAEFSLTGIKTNIPLHVAILQHPKFLDGSYTTQFLEKDFKGTEIFRFIDDRVFLITAAIEAYSHQKELGIWDLNLTSQWKEVGRKGLLRGLTY
ncbi:MAG: acetyl-CoA carboxylase biotin carboxylase subunit [Bdellovibrionales bacterium]|nr:acetyl-CoA carboxylase biotin carboxylase subunit [Bdellovibrionales bacterium]